MTVSKILRKILAGLLVVTFLLGVFTVHVYRTSERALKNSEEALAEARSADHELDELEDRLQPVVDQLRDERAAMMRNAGFYITQSRGYRSADYWCVARNATSTVYLPERGDEYKEIGPRDATYLVQSSATETLTPAICAFESKQEAATELGTKRLVEEWMERYPNQTLPQNVRSRFAVTQSE